MEVEAAVQSIVFLSALPRSGGTTRFNDGAASQAVGRAFRYLANRRVQRSTAPMPDVPRDQRSDMLGIQSELDVNGAGFPPQP